MQSNLHYVFSNRMLAAGIFRISFVPLSLNWNLTQVCWALCAAPAFTIATDELCFSYTVLFLKLLALDVAK